MIGKTFLGTALRLIGRGGNHIQHRFTTEWSLLTFGKLGSDSLICHPCRVITPKAISIGSRAYIGPGAHLSVGAGLTVGDDFMAGPNLMVLGGNHDLDPILRLERVSRPENSAEIRIGNNVWIGANVILLAGCTIGDDSVIAAGAVVNQPMPDGVVAGGVPARVLRRLDDEG